MPSPPEEQTDSVPTLNYGTSPKPPSAHTALGAFFGVIAGMFALLSLLLGLAWLIYATFFERRRVDRPEDFTKGIILTGIGLLCAGAAWRWTRSAIRRDASVNESPQSRKI